MFRVLRGLRDARSPFAHDALRWNPLSDLIGRSLGHFRVVEKIGEGGMGVVYLAEDTRLGRKVALKVLPPELSSDAGRRARFEREARAVAALNHPNIVTIHSVEEHDGLCFLTMELVEGQPLSHLFAGPALPLARLLDLSIGISEALVAAHRQGVVHRDLKPSNLLVHESGVKVLDFGLAQCSAHATPGSRATWRSRCCRPAWSRTRSGASDSSARRAPSRAAMRPARTPSRCTAGLRPPPPGGW